MTDAAIGERTVTLTWPDATSSEFHYIWLRDNCACAECKHPDAWERLFDNVEMNLDVRPSQVVFDEALEITWSDGHHTTMSNDWLRSNRYDRESRAEREVPSVLWTSEISKNPPKISLLEIDSGDDGLRRWLTLVRDYGFAIVTDVPTKVGAVVELAERIAHIQETQFWPRVSSHLQT